VGRPLSPEQTSFFRAGHAHAGVLVSWSSSRWSSKLMLDHSALSPELTSRAAHRRAAGGDLRLRWVLRGRALPGLPAAALRRRGAGLPR